MHEAELITVTKPHVVSETAVPGDNNVMRVQRMSDGTVNIFYGTRFIGTFVEGSDASLAAILEATVDFALERKQAQLLEHVNSPEFEKAARRWLGSNSSQRKSLFNRIFG